MEIIYRKAVPEDAGDIREIYQHYIDFSTATFATGAASREEYEDKINNRLYPFWVAVKGNRILGFAYASRLRPKEAYVWDVELTIYLHPETPELGGIGSELYKRLLREVEAYGYRNAYGIITGNNLHSIAFHEKLGFTKIAHIPKMGYKHGMWLDVVWMHKAFGDFEEIPELPKPYRTNGKD